MDKTKLYSPNQVLGGSFLGGPAAAVYFVWRNFKALGNNSGAMQTLVWGALFNVVLLLALPFLPDKFPNFAIPIIYSWAARFVAERFQMPKPAIEQSEHYEFQSTGSVVGIGIGFLSAYILVFVAFLFVLVEFGLIEL
jgi:hypothetical protein